MDVIEKIKTENKTIAQVSREVGTDPNYLYRKLQEPDWNPGVNLAVRIAKALNTTVEELWPSKSQAA